MKENENVLSNVTSITKNENQFVKDMLELEGSIHAGMSKSELYKMMYKYTSDRYLLLLLCGALKDYAELEALPHQARTLEWYDARSKLRDEIANLLPVEGETEDE